MNMRMSLVLHPVRYSIMIFGCSVVVGGWVRYMAFIIVVSGNKGESYGMEADLFRM